MAITNGKRYKRMKEDRKSKKVQIIGIKALEIY